MKRDGLLLAVFTAQDMNVADCRERGRATGEAQCLHHIDGTAEREFARAIHLADDVDAIAPDLLDGNGDHRIEPMLNLTLNHFRFDSDPAYGSNTLPAAPEYFLRGELMYRNMRGYFAGPTFDFVGRRYSDFANTYSVGAYGLAGLRAGFSTPRWEIFGELRNLLDRNYIATIGVMDQTSPDASVLYPGAPRSIYLGLRHQF